MTINWNSDVITIVRTDTFMTETSTDRYEMDVDDFRLELKALLASEEGIPFTDTHIHNTEVTLAGVTYARFIEIIDPYTVTFEDGQYAVTTIGANHNIVDRKNFNQVSVITNNSAGLIVSSVSITPGDLSNIADAVWDEILSEHLDTGSTGEKLKKNLKKSQFLGLK